MEKMNGMLKWWGGSSPTEAIEMFQEECGGQTAGRYGAVALESNYIDEFLNSRRKYGSGSIK